jgi:hypothetical protein
VPKPGLKNRLPRCHATTNKGEQCRARQVPGTTLCMKHGALRAATAEKASSEVTVASVPVGRFLEMGPFESARLLTARAHQIAEALTRHLEGKGLETWTRTKHLPGGGSEPVIDPLVRLWVDAVDQARKAANDLARLNLEELALRLEVARFGALAKALEVALGVTDLEPAAKAAIVDVFAAELGIGTGS